MEEAAQGGRTCARSDTSRTHFKLLLTLFSVRLLLGREMSSSPKANKMSGGLANVISRKSLGVTCERAKKVRISTAWDRASRKEVP